MHLFEIYIKYLNIHKIHHCQVVRCIFLDQHFLLAQYKAHPIVTRWLLWIIFQVLLNLIFLAHPTEVLSPCEPSPCGSNAICEEQNGAGSCRCQPDYYGNPYEGCRPECTLNSDCVSSLACVKLKCQNPCIGVCGQNAECQVINHLPMCLCPAGFTGNPFNYCRPFQESTSKSLDDYSAGLLFY